MRIKIDGRELLVKKTTRGLVALQQQTGWKLEDIDKRAREGYAGAMAAFFALVNAGFSPVWDEVIDRDIEDFEFVKEAGDERFEPQGDDASDPQSSRADSDPGGNEEAPVEPTEA